MMTSSFSGGDKVIKPVPHGLMMMQKTVPITLVLDGMKADQ